MDGVAENIATGAGAGAPKEFKMPSMEDFQKFIDKMEVSDEEKEELMKAFTGSKDNIFAPPGAGFDPAEAARLAMRRTAFAAGGFSGPNYLYFFVTIGIIGVLLGYIAYRLIKYVQAKEEPKLARADKKKALKAEKKLQKQSSPKKTSAATAAGSPKGTSNGSSSGSKQKKA